MGEHVDKIQVAPHHLERIRSNRRLHQKFLEVTAKPGEPVLPHVRAEMIQQLGASERCPECGADLEGVVWSVGRFPPIPVYGLRCPNAELTDEH